MENISLQLNDGLRFDEILKNSLSDGGDLEIITKEGATVSGRPAVMLTFSVQLPDGSLHQAQTVTTVRLLSTVLRGLEAKYGHEF